MNDASLQESVESLVARVADEFIERHKQGERPDIEEYAVRHPEAAELLRNVLAALDIVGLASSPSHRRSDLHSLPADETPHLLGDFRIIREVGRGGMGVVYEAEQVSLGRRVALKVLPFAATLDPRHLQRFKNEAQAAAQLHHTNMVPVFSVGCERGTHFYAMQFIDGVTLAAAIADVGLQIADSKKPADDPEATRAHPAPDAEAICNLKSEICNPTMVALSTERSLKSPAFFRTVAQLGIQAAEALDYAHQVGIVHRDIKPANLMLETSSPLSFGRGVGGEGKGEGHLRLWVTDFGLAHIQHAEGALTMTGDLIGTLRYMSPEQALAKRVVIDHRTDIYSLGATLYELLTLEPVFHGRDRQDLLRQIAFDDPRLPRKLNKAIPAELETIVMKALEKNPADRYATAQEMADDLRRFLSDEPIRARRPKLVQRVRKWARRHKTLVASIVVSFLTALLLGGVWAGWHYNDRLSRQRATEMSVTEALAQAKTLIEEGYKLMDDNPGRMEASMKQAELAMLRAEQLTASGISSDELEVRVREVRQAIDAARTDSKLLTELDRMQIEKARTDTVNSQFDAKRCAALYATLLPKYGINLADPGAAAQRLRSSRLREILIAAIQDWWHFINPESVEGKCLEKLLVATEPTDGFWPQWRAAVVRRDGSALVRFAREAREDLRAASVVNLAMGLVSEKQWIHAERILRTWQERYPGNFWLNHCLGFCLTELKKPDEALRYLTAALALRHETAGVHVNVAAALYVKGDFDGAIRAYQVAVKIHPQYASAHAGIGSALREKRDFDGAIRALKRALRIEPNYAAAQYHLGLTLVAKGEVDGAIDAYRAALEIAPKFAEAHTNLGALFVGKKADVDGAMRHFAAALDVQPDLVQARDHLGLCLFLKGDIVGAIREFQAALKIDPNYTLSQQHLRVAEKLSQVLKGERQPADATECLELALHYIRPYNKLYATGVRFFAEAFAAQPQLAEDLRAQYRYNAACFAALAGCGHGKDAPAKELDRAGLRRQALDWLRADLVAYRQQMEKDRIKARPGVVKAMQHWQRDSDFAGVRGSEALGRLPESERADWHKFWQELAAFEKRAGQK
ncbi:MAG: tetratricopeptide repeat protein [Planctomycetes bacterium]|nr:tetratricopeptide repeat protein [Planctomycetota bacterium]